MGNERQESEGRNFFQAAVLTDIFGRDTSGNRATVKIDQDRYNLLMHRDPQIKIAEQELFKKEFGLRGALSFALSREGIFINEGPLPELAWWAPHRSERALLLQLAHSLKGDHDKPLVFDAACGTGFLIKALAVDGDINAIGIEPDGFRISRLSSVASSATLQQGFVYRSIEQVEPKYRKDLDEQRNKLLQKVNKRLSVDTPYVVYQGMNLGYKDDLSTEVQRLQEIAPQYEAPSPVDIAVCSFMPPNVELTTSLRDGIYPKAIIYVRPLNGNSGAGDYYLDEPIPEELHAAVISFNPGSNYRLAARWITFSKMGWETQRGWKSEGAEVLVQLRNDIGKLDSPDVKVEQYPWDMEIEGRLRRQSQLDVFSTGIDKARESLFDKK